MDESLRAAFAQTDYRVNLGCGAQVSIRVGQPLPPELLALLPHADAPWGFISACNPRSQPQSTSANEQAQDRLLTALRRHVPKSPILHGTGIGSGADPWREPSLLVIDVPLQTLEALMRQFGQYAIVQGVGAAAAMLHWNPDLGE